MSLGHKSSALHGVLRLGGEKAEPWYSPSNAEGEERPSAEQKVRGGTGKPGLQVGPRQKETKRQANGDGMGAGAGDSGSWAEVLHTTLLRAGQARREVSKLQAPPFRCCTNALCIQGS